jgi:hypothetical protein
MITWSRHSRRRDPINRSAKGFCQGQNGAETNRDTVRSETSMPSFCHSPWIRGAPQSGFAAAISSTSDRMAPSMLGRSERIGSERRAQRRRSHWRCHRTTVSGRTTIKAVRHSRQALASRIHPPGAGEQDPKEPVTRPEQGPLAGARQRGQLLTKRQVLQNTFPVSAAQQSDGRRSTTSAVSMRHPGACPRQNQPAGAGRSHFGEGQRYANVPTLAGSGGATSKSLANGTNHDILAITGPGHRQRPLPVE